MSLRVFRRVPYRLSGSPESSSVLLSPTLEVFRLAPSPLDLTRAVHPLSDFSPLQRPFGCRPLPPQAASCSLRSEASSHEVLRPSSVRPWRVGWNPAPLSPALPNRFGSSRSTIPPRPFSGPRGVDPHHALRPCFMPLTLLGFLLSRVSTPRAVLPGSSPGETLSAFPLAFRPANKFTILPAKPRPQGFVQREGPYPPFRSIASRSEGRIPPELPPPPRPSRSPGWSRSHDSSAHGLTTSPSKLGLVTDLQRLPTGFRYISCPRKLKSSKLLPTSRSQAYAVLVSLAFLLSPHQAGSTGVGLGPRYVPAAPSTPHVAGIVPGS